MWYDEAMQIEISDVEIIEIALEKTNLPIDSEAVAVPIITSPVMVTLSNGVNYTGDFIRGSISTTREYSWATIELENGNDTIRIMGRIYLDSRSGIRKVS
jgi:hypothetical protein